MDRSSHSTTSRAMSEKQQNNELKILTDDLLTYGDLLLIANKGIGKTNALMILTEHLRRHSCNSLRRFS